MEDNVWVEVTHMDGDGNLIPVKMTTTQAAEAIVKIIMPRTKYFTISYVVDAVTGNTTVVKVSSDPPPSDDDETKVLDPKELGNGR